MNSCWSTKKLIEICEKHFSGIWGKEAKKCGNAYVVRVSDIKEGGIIDYKNTPLRYIEPDKLKKFQLQEGDLLVVKSSGSKTRIISGRTAIFEKKDSKVFCPSNFLLTLRPNKNLVLPKWLWLYLNSEEAKEFVRKIIGATTYPNIRPVDYLNFEIPLLPLHIQKRIVARIEELFEKIDKAKELREKVKEETEQIFQLTLSQIFEKAKRKWGVKKIGEICSINPSKSELRNLPDNLEVSFIPMSFIDEVSGSIIAQKKKLLGEVKKGYTYFRENDVLFAKITPCMEKGKSAIAKNLINNIGFGSTEFHVLRPLNEVLPEWIYFYIRQPWFRKEAKKYFTGTAGQQRVPQEFLERTEIPLPPLSEQKKIVAYLDDLREKIEKLKKLQENQLKDLEELKKSILEKAFKGELL